MNLINQTVVPAVLTVAEHGEGRDGASRRSGALVAKVTLDVGAGSVMVADDSPVPVLNEETRTENGQLPRDFVSPRHWSGTEVVACAAAYLHGASDRTVRMTVGTTTEILRVRGDRLARSDGTSSSTAPLATNRVPIRWSRTYGGTLEVDLDAHSTIPVPYGPNRYGRGFVPSFDPRGDLRSAGYGKGFPRLPDHVHLANVTLPEGHDETIPVSWESMPIDLGLRAQDRATASEMFCARPNWRLDGISAGDRVELEGCHPRRAIWGFQFPRLDVLADYVLGERTGSFRLRPELLVLLPEEDRATVTYRYMFRFSAQPSEERSLRLRIE